MNPLTNVKNINKLNETEAELGVAGGKSSWHEQYKDSAYIFIGGLPYDLTEGDIICVFSQYGEIMNINLVRDKKTGKSKGYCFLAYEDQRSTILAVDNFNGIKLLGRVLRVDHVSNYRKPKEDENDDEITQRLRQEGCAPRTPSPPPSEEEEGDEDSYQIATKKSRKEHKAKSKSKEKKKKKKRKKDSKHSSKMYADSSDSDSSPSDSDQLPRPAQVKREIDSDFNVKTEYGERDSTGRHKKHRRDEFSRGEEEEGWHRNDVRKELKRERVTEGKPDMPRERDRDRAGDLSGSRRGNNREGHTRRDDDAEKQHDGGSYRRDRYPDERDIQEGHRHVERDRAGERRGDRDAERWQDSDRRRKYESEGSSRVPVGEGERGSLTARQRDTYRERQRETDTKTDWDRRADRDRESSYKGGGRDWDSARERDRSRREREGTSRERDYYKKRDR